MTPADRLTFARTLVVSVVIALGLGIWTFATPYIGTPCATETMQGALR